MISWDRNKEKRWKFRSNQPRQHCTKSRKYNLTLVEPSSGNETMKSCKAAPKRGGEQLIDARNSFKCLCISRLGDWLSKPPTLSDTMSNKINSTCTRSATTSRMPPKFIFNLRRIRSFRKIWKVYLTSSILKLLKRARCKQKQLRDLILSVGWPRSIVNPKKLWKLILLPSSSGRPAWLTIRVVDCKYLTLGFIKLCVLKLFSSLHKVRLMAAHWRRIWRDLFRVQWRELQMQIERRLNGIEFHDRIWLKF